MNIVLICTSAEPGRDGVGDYSVRLASALMAQGHRLLVIAERDLAVADREPARGEREGVSVLRLPARASNAERARWLADELNRVSPDWVVLQFVCWGYADRGILDPPLVELLAALSSWRVAIYCHELWLGLERGASLRHRWWGRRQRISILRFLEQLKPRAVFTSNPAYCEVLERYGWRAQIVPLFSNIPVHTDAATKLLALLESKAGRALWNARSDVVMLAVFGSVYREWKPEAALRWLQAEARRRNRRVVFVAAGRPSPKGETVLTRLAGSADSSMTFVSLGEVPTDIVSALLLEADIGLPATEWLVLGKSGVAAAMRAHGLPMLVVRHGQSFRELPALDVRHGPSVFRFDAAAPPDFDQLTLARASAADTLSDTVKQFLKILEHAPST